MFRHQEQFSKLARSALIGFAFAATPGSATAAQARSSVVAPAPQDSQLRRTARAIVRVNVVGRECPMFYAVDRARVQDIEQTLFNKGLDQFGKDKLRQAINVAEGEFSIEFEADGAATWCPAQRTHFDSLGVRDLVGEPRE
ncbi:hypothetical protein MKK63_04230 [Methylobacterium sp. J-088]|uniref:hypothetical protein n=1 Tax=Methylobacterium sp. J-088 TaxID=2836664 RepID=UPI001FBB527F|nr:hypothetical protein [Methylobacterium sp. J-088]MCJ2061908.1 hypothetical protein [Methylobacterium sp. J-088]